MHPLEHLVYFTVFLLWWIVPAAPIVITLTDKIFGTWYDGTDEAYGKLGRHVPTA